jgi:uncharacterized membrane protein
MEYTRVWIEMASAGLEALAVAIMVSFIAIVTVRWLLHIGQKVDGAYERYRVAVGKALLVGLELLVAADIIRTVALDASLTNVGILSALVLIRTFLGWTLTVEVEGHWPWQNGLAAAGAKGWHNRELASETTTAKGDLRN